MKGRSHRLQTSDPPDDWIDGSWTVDCICGVNFDDGEEMVKCDECGVWVHTRCSRYVKGDDMFACDKCKSKSNRNDTEETEVAQLLVELPTKTMRMENTFASNGPSRRPFKLWTDIPMEERVHVQGIPGGDPSMFGCLPSIFSPELWKCSGYIPKKFNFQYREFPSWDESSGMEEENENPIDKGAGVLFSFSNESILATRVAAIVDMSSGKEEDGFNRMGSLKELKRDNEDTEVVRSDQNGIKKERSLLRPAVMHSGKQKKEDFGTSRDRSGKKRVKTSEKELDPKRRSSHSSKADFTSSWDAKQIEFIDDRDLKIFKDDTRSIKSKTTKDIVLQEHISNDIFSVDTILEEPNNNLATMDDSSDALHPDPTRCFSVQDVITEEKTGHKVTTLSSKTDDAVPSVLKHNYVQNASIKGQEGDCLEVDTADDSIIIGSTLSLPLEDICGSASELKDNQVGQDFDSAAQFNSKVKREGDDDNFRKLLNIHSSPICDYKNNEKSSDHMSDDVKVNDTTVMSSTSFENKVEGVHRKSEVVIDYQTYKPDELSGDICHAKQEMEGSEASMGKHNGCPETKYGLGSAEEPSNSETLVCPHKLLHCLGKSLSTPTLNSKSLGNDIKFEDTEIPNPLAKHGVMADCNIHIKKESFPTDVARDDVPRKSVRERQKSSSSNNSKAFHSSRSVQKTVSKQGSSDSKDSVHCLSFKASSVHQPAINLGLSESISSLHHQKALQTQNKISSSVTHRGEKFSQTNFQLSSKLNQNNVPSINPSPTPNSSAMLSDEELALLLHQELNSSPRVPRVPRARQAGSLPQLTSASTTSMLIKRTSSVGGKDHCVVSRRKYKDASRDGLCSSLELDDAAKRMENVSSSSDQRKQDVAYIEDAPVKEEGRTSMAAINSNSKNLAPASSATANSSPSSPLEDQNFSSIRNSPRNISDDDTGTAGRPVHRTLPGLINEIMSKGRRMTYEELCNAVLPHWHNLRKHNGERYAYSSHSQAVLDCLRNRHEWARLVDRGPKTNSNRKRRKLGAEESDDNAYGKCRNAKEVEGKNFELQKEEFPKGKRKARKRRRLVLQGRAVKDVRKRQKADPQTEDDVGPFSNSSEESLFSEEETQRDSTCRIGSDAFDSSDEAGSA